MTGCCCRAHANAAMMIFRVPTGADAHEDYINYLHFPSSVLNLRETKSTSLLTDEEAYEPSRGYGLISDPFAKNLACARPSV